MSRGSVRILCVDDHEFLAEGLKRRLGLEPDLELVGWLDSAENLLQEVRRTGADIVLLDIEMPGPDPFAVMADLRRQLPEVRTVMFSAYVRDHYLDAATKAGAWGYVSKSDPPESVVEAIRTVIGDKFALGPTVQDRCKPRPKPGEGADHPASPLDQLTPRELHILRMIGKGMSRTDIATAICRSPKTVDNHRAAIMRKLGIHERSELTRFALREGLTEA